MWTDRKRCLCRYPSSVKSAYANRNGVRSNHQFNDRENDQHYVHRNPGIVLQYTQCTQCIDNVYEIFSINSSLCDKHCCTNLYFIKITQLLTLLTLSTASTTSTAYCEFTLWIYYHYFISPRTITSSIEMPESGYNRILRSNKDFVFFCSHKVHSQIAFLKQYVEELMDMNM